MKKLSGFSALLLILSLLLSSCQANSPATSASPQSPSASASVPPTYSALNSTHWSTFTTKDGLAGKVITGVIQDMQGLIWVASTDGLTRFIGGDWEPYVSSINGTYVISAAQDNKGNLWFGTVYGGAFEYTGQEWHNFTPANTGGGLPGTEINAMLVDNHDNIWFATEGNIGQRTPPIAYGVTRYNGTNWTSFLDRTNVTTIFQDKDGNLWFGTNVGVIRYDGSQWQTFTIKDGLADGYVVSIVQDNQGDLWFGTWSKGVSRYDGKNWRTFIREDGLVSSAIHCMLNDKDGNLWFGAYDIDHYVGISRFDGAVWQNFNPWQGTNASPDYNVISIFQDSEGNVWFATSVGLVKYNPD